MPLRPTITLLPCLLLSLALGGCFAAGPGAESAPELNAQASAAPAGSTGAIPTGRAASVPKPPPEPARSRTASTENKDDDWGEGGVTREKINGMCWMKAEGHRGLSVDKRAEFVDRCVNDTLKKYPLN